MNVRALLHILLCCALLFPAGVSTAVADTISRPVSVAIPASVNGEMDSKPVSVAVPTGVNGEMDSRPVSVAIPEGMYGSMSAKPVSVAIPEGMYGSMDGRPVTAAIQPENLGDPDLVGMWHLDGDGGDSSGNNNNLTPINGASFSSDKKIGTQAAGFNGSNTYLRASSGNNMPRGNSPRTFMAWIKPYSYLDSTYNGIFAYGQMSCGKGSLLSIKNDGRLSMAFWCNDASQTTGPAATLNTWNHVALTYDGGTTVKFYMNGQFVQESSLGSLGPAGPANTQDGPIRIGSTDDPGRVFNGLIDEVSVYKRVLTAEEIAFFANAAPGDPAAPPSPVLSPAPPAVVGANTITLSGTKTIGTSIWVNNKKIAPLDNTEVWQGTYGTLQPGINLLNVIAVDATLKQSPAVTASVIYDNSPPSIESSYPANNSDTAKPVSSVTINLTDTYSPIDLAQSRSGATVTNSKNQIVPGAWTASGAKTIIFTPVTAPLPSDSYLVTIFPTDAVGNRGQQQIAFTNHDISPPVTTLSTKEAKAIDGWYYSAVTITLVATDGPDGSGVAKTEYSFDGTVWTTYAAPFGIGKDGVNTVYYRSADKAGNVETTKSSQIKINKTALVGLWHMDSDWLDSSVVGNNATLVSNATFSSNAKIGTYAGSFNGSNSYVSIPDAPTLHAERNITVLGWMYVNSLSSVWQSIFWKGNAPDCTTNCENREYTLWLNSSGLLHLASTPEDRVGIGQMYISTPAGVINTAANTPANNGWQHFAAVISSDQNIMKIYVNGVEQASGAYSSANIRDTSGALYIGTNPTWNSAFNGLIDELAIYKRALSPLEIQENYRSYSIGVPTIDTVPPGLTVTNSASLALAGTKPANTAVVVNGTMIVSRDTQTAWRGTYTLQPGMNNLNVTAMDADSFHSQAVILPVALDVAAPAVTSTSPVNNGIFNTSVSTVAFNLADAFSAIDSAATGTGALVANSSGTVVPGTWSTTVSGMTGSVVFTPAAALAEGTYVATIKPTDALGNQTTSTLTFTVDTTPPSAPKIDPILTPIRTTTKTISGTKSLDSAKVVVGCAGAIVGDVSYPTSFTWSVTVSGLHEGSNTVTAYAVDAATNASASTQMTFTVDTIPPGQPVVLQAATLTRLSSVILTGTKDGTKDAGSYLFVNNVKTPAAYADTAWSYTANLSSEGNNAFVLFAQDEAGNPSKPVTVNVVRDTTAPRIASATPSINGSVNQLPAIDIALIDDNSAVDLQASLANAQVKNPAGSIVNGSWAGQNGHIIFTPAAGTVLSDGLYTVAINPADILGNAITLTFSFTIDTAAPAMLSLTMNPTSPHKDETVSFIVVFSEDMLTSVQPSVSFARECLLCFTSTPISSGNWVNSRTWSGSYPFTASTGDGSYSVKIADAKDKAGNVMVPQSLAGAFILDTTPPPTPGVVPVTPLTNNPNQVLNGTREAGSAILINGSQRVPADPNPATTTAWTYSMPLSEGTNTLNIVARDAAGNDSILPRTVVIVLDTTPPAFAVSFRNPSSTATQVLTGSKEPNCVVKLNNAQIFSALDSSPTWSYTVTLTSGITNHFVFTAADALGNTTTRAVDILYDNAPPAPLGPNVLVADGSGNGTEITLTWTAYQETTDVAYYAVYKSLSAFSDVTGMVPVGTVNKGVKTYKATGLMQSTTYYFAVVPVDLAGNQVNAVNTASAKPTDTMAPEDVTNLSATAGYSSAQSNFISLTWTPSINSTGDLADQILYVDGGTGYDAGTPLGKTATTYTKPGLSDAAKYKFKITVKDALGHESQGTVVEAVTRLSNPSNLTASPAGGKVALAWGAVSSPYVRQYNVYRKTATVQQTDIAAMTLVSVVKGATAYTDTGLVNDTTYQYAVTVVNTWGAERADVQSISATPRADSTGPVIDTFSIVAGQVVTAPITITATAHDAESAMGSMEISIDGAIVASQAGGSISYFWNVIASTDGNHTVKVRALDSRGNPTEDPRQVIVSLAPPAAPAITNPPAGNRQGSVVSVSGTAPLFTTVALRLNGVVVGTTQTLGTSGTGTFGFPSVTLVPGDNLLAAKASHRGGDSPYSPDTRITVITGAPPAPQNLSAQVLAGGLIRLTWTAAAGQVPAGYNLYSGISAFASTTDTGVTKTNATPIAYLLKEYLPADDVLKYYAVTAVDSVGNESGLSNIVSLASDRLAPSMLSVRYDYAPDALLAASATSSATVAGKGSVKVAIAVSEKLQQPPFFSLEPAQGAPIVVALSAVDDTHYAGTFAVTDQSPQGPTTYKFSAKDMAGNRGDAQGAGIAIDVQGPKAAVQSPLYTQKILPDPVTVTIALDEPSISTPSLSLKALNGATTSISGLSSADNGIHWTGTANVSAMPEGKAEFILAGAQDKLGNVGTAVSAGRYLLLYLNTVPSPGIPDGLAAKSGKGGAVTLTWYPVAYTYSDLSTVTYNLYRRAEGEASATKVQTGIGLNLQNATTAQDIPPADGAYYYSVTSVGLLGSESPASVEVRAISDRTGPPAPTGLALTFGPGGVTAKWNAVVDALMGYNLYRSSAPFTTSTGLTPVSKTANEMGVDTSPSKTYRFYAVAAVDALGNEGPLSATQEIVFQVSPVGNLVLQKIDDAAPTITWQTPTDSAVSGYNIYRNGSLITLYPVPDLSYTDAYAVPGTTYGVSAVDSIGKESPVKTVTLPAMTLGLRNGTVFRRGLLETIPVVLSLGTGTGVSIDTVDVQVGTAPLSSIQGPFALAANTTLQLAKVAATTADALSPVAVFIRANWSPSPGATVKISRTVSADVLGSGTSFEIFNEPLMRSTDAKVRLKVNNIGSSQMEFVTSENNGKSSKVRVNLRDQDGNLLSTGSLDQRIGNAIVNGANYAVARLDPGASFTTDPITLPVPASAPNAVVIEAVIDNTYYHYSQPDQVTAPGLKGVISAAIQQTPYRAVAAPDKTFYASAQPVLITGSAISNNPAANNALVPNVPVKIGVSVNGFDRFFTVTTDATGHFTYTFTPGSSEAGAYSLWAVHPDVRDRTVQATFSIAGLSITPNVANVTMARSRTLDIPVTVQNYGGGSLTGLAFDATSTPGIAASVTNSGGALLAAGETRNLTVHLATDASASNTGTATVTVRTAEGPSAALNAAITVVNAIPVISTSPSFIDTGMVRGDQKIVTFTITNAGLETLRNARLSGLSTPWMILTSNPNAGDIAPGASATVGIMIKPDSTIAQGVYDDVVVISADNHGPYSYHIRATVTTNRVGNALFDVMDEFFTRVAGASITVQNQQMPSLLYTVKTDAAGNASLFDIPEGRYAFNITAPSHTPASGTFTVTTGITTVVPVGMQANLVTVTWSVTPTTIPDQYQITVSQTYQTNVPAAVIVTEPPAIQVPALQPGQVFNGEFTITNYGLIAADYKGLNFPASVGDYDIEVLATIPGRLAAQQKVTVPYRITRRVTTAKSGVPGAGLLNALNSDPRAHESMLFDEVKGYGGVVGSSSPVTLTITTTFTQVICPNTPNQTTVTITTMVTITIMPADTLNTATQNNTSGQTSAGANNTNTTYTYNQYIPTQTNPSGSLPTSGTTSPLTMFNCSAGSVPGSGGAGGGGGTGGTGGTGSPPACSGIESVLVSQSTFTNGIGAAPAGSIAIASPADRAAVSGPKVVVKGAVDDTMMVNSITVLVTGQTSTQGTSYMAQMNGKYFAAAVNLNAGVNTIKATVAYLNGQKKETSITVTANNQPQKVQIWATPASGTLTQKPDGRATLDVSFRVTSTLLYPAASYAWDFNGDGSVDLACGSLSAITARYQQTGIYLATVTVTDNQGNKYTDTVIVNVLDRAAMGDFFTQKWNAMKNALLAGDIAGAVNHYAVSSKDFFKEQFNFLGANINKMVGDMGAFGLVRLIDENTAECELQTVSGGVTYSFQVLFVRDTDGIWGIYSF